MAVLRKYDDGKVLFLIVFCQLFFVEHLSMNLSMNLLSSHYSVVESTTAVIWLKYCQYGVNLYPINQSINQSINH